MSVAHAELVIPVFMLMKNQDETPSINLILFTLGYMLIVPIILGVTRPTIPSKSGT